MRGATETLSLRELAEAVARGRRLSQAETIAVCEALRARAVRSPNQFHSGM